VTGAGDPPAALNDPPMAERLRGVQPWRRIFHAGNSLVLAFLPPLLGVNRWVVVGILSALLAGLIAFDWYRLRRAELNALFFRMFPSLASDRERTGVASSTWYALGVIVVYALFPAWVVVPAILTLGLADPAASTVGRIWGRRRIGKGTVLGTTVFVAVAFAIMATAVGPVAGLVAALATAAVEVLPVPLDDNLTVPVTAATALWLVAG
jgi:dolichol kinase